jgi:hypothetical protein
MHIFHKWSPWSNPEPVYNDGKDTICAYMQFRTCSKCNKQETYFRGIWE